MSASTLVERWVRIAVEGGEMAAFHVAPERGPVPGLVMLQEIFGVNAAMQEQARRFAALGYGVLVPDLFWRQQPRVDLGYGPDDRKRGFELMQGFDPVRGAADIAASARWLAAQPGRSGGLGVIGFCLGGRLAVAAQAAHRFDAVVSLYGVRLDADPAALRRLDVPFQFHVGDRDAHVPAESVDAVRKAVDGRPDAQVFVYPGAQHGFYNPLRAEVFAQEAAALAERRIAGLLSAALVVRA
jgi:carboxymethylenebutenolidase